MDHPTDLNVNHKTLKFLEDRGENLHDLEFDDDFLDTLVAQRLKHPPGMQETWVRSLGGEDPLEKENGNPLQYSCLENPMEGGSWQATVHGVTKSWTRLSDFTFTSLLDTTRKAQFVEESSKKLDFIKIKSFCSVKRMKKQFTVWNKLFVKDTSDKGFYSKYMNS